MKKLYRSRNNKMISGLCGGLGEMLNVDVTLCRILLVILTFVTSGTMILVYFIVSLIVPKAPDIFNPYQNGGYGPGPGGFNGGHGGGNGGPGGFGGQGGFGGPGGFGGNQQYNRPDSSQYSNQRQWQPPTQSTGGNNIDSMMDDLEKKALRNEIEQLKKKLNEVEKKGE